MTTSVRVGLVVLVVTAAVAVLFGAGALPPGAAPTGAVAAAPSPEETPEVTDPPAGPPPSAGTGRDPLAPAELTRARALAAGTTGRDVTGAAGAEYLSFELADPVGADRRAALYFYDYATDELVKQLVNLSAGRLEDAYRATEMQPPPAEREVGTAFRLLLADPAAGAAFRSRWAGDIGTPFTDPAQAAVTAQTYIAHPGAEPAGQCGRHRCLQLLPRDAAGGDFVDVNDFVVDLSGPAVVRLG